MNDDSTLAALRPLLAGQRWREARPLLERLHAARPTDRAALYQLCEAEIGDGAAQQALERLQALPANGDVEAAFLHARAQAALGRHDAARAELEALRARLPGGSANLEMHLAAAQQACGDAKAAIASVRSAVALAPRMAAAHVTLASLLLADGDATGACDSLALAVAAAPGEAGLRINLARAQSMLARPQQALQSLREAVAAGPRDAAAWHAIGQMYAEHFEWQQAGAALARATQLEPGTPTLEVLTALVSGELGDTAGAGRALERAAARAPGNLHVAVTQRLMLPQVYADAADLERWRERYAKGMDELLELEPRWRTAASPVFELNHSNFLLAYQGRDDCELQGKYSGFVRRLAEAAWPGALDAPQASFDGGRPLRVGFASSFFRDCTIGRYFERWIGALEGARFERFVYHAGALSDDFTRRIAGRSERFALLRSGALDAAQRIRADRLDLLVYPEIGMDPIGYLLAALRLAPVQMAAWGHPVTTGSRAIDRFLTVDAMEPAGAQQHYVEKLIALPMPGVGYAMPPAAPAMTRADFGLPAGARIYACPQSLFKIHPDNDALFASILDRDPEALLLFFQAPAAAVGAAFGARLQRALAAHGVAARGQVKLMPRMGSAHFRALLAVCDVVLDTLHWSGGNTSFDAFAVGVPVVTLPGRFMRGRQTAAMLQAMALPELVAGDAADYVRLALAAAGDRDANHALRERIATGRAAIFERPEPLEALQEALLAAAARAA